MQTIKVNDKKALPLLAWMVMFGRAKGYYLDKELKLTFFKTFRGGWLKKISFKEKTYLQQNPYTSSKYANLARKGHMILWIVDNSTGKYNGRVEDGKVEMY
jgi:hypothetical protein